MINAQDLFAQLVEDVRIGQVGRPVGVSSPVGTKFIPYRPDIDLTLPVFHMIGDHHQIPTQPALEAWEKIKDKSFHLPYPRCAFIMSIASDHPGLQHLAPRFHIPHHYVMVMEEDDEGLHFVSFMRHEKLDHWVRQLFDIDIVFETQEVVTTYDPAWGTFPLNFIASVEESLWQRLQGVMAFVHQLMNRHGAASPVAGSQITDKINARRAKMELPPVGGVIAIDLTKLPAEPSKGTSAGTPKKPHFRRGSWHTRKATGQRSWHPPVAVHGGSEIVPPWYEVRM